MKTKEIVSQFVVIMQMPDSPERGATGKRLIEKLNLKGKRLHGIISKANDIRENGKDGN